MRSVLFTRVIPFLVLFVAVVIISAAGTLLVYARGPAFSLGPWGALAHVPLDLAMALAIWAVLTRIKKLAPRDIGLTWGPRDGLALGLAALAAIAAVGLGALALSVTGVAPLSASSASPSVGVLLAGLAALAGNALFQQLPLQSFALAVSKDKEPSAAAVLFAALLFVGSHVDANAAAVSLLNTGLFAVVTSLLFFRRATPSYAAPVGFHAGWNFTETFLLGCPVGGEEQRLGVLRWPTQERLLSGGAGGFFGGLTATFILVALAGLLLLERARRARADQQA